MANLEISLERVRSISRWSLCGDHLLSRLRDRYLLRYVNHGQQIITFGTRSETKAVWTYLKHLRANPNRAYDLAVGQSIGRILNHSPSFYEALQNSCNQNSQILLRFNDRDNPLLTNIPWELGLLPNGIVRQPIRTHQENTLSAFAFARIATAFQSNITIDQHEMLRVLVCISDPDEAHPIGGLDFFNQVNSELSIYKWLMQVTNVVGQINDGVPNFKPTITELNATISQSKPHVLILVSHGQTSTLGPSVLFSENGNNQWHDLDKIARELRKTGCCISAILTACDLTYSTLGYTSNSGALKLLEYGIPSVIAMQCSIRVSAGQQFLQNVLAHFTKGFHIRTRETFTHSVSHARTAIADRTPQPNDQVDWCFPALFYSNDGAQKLSDIERFVNTHSAWVQTLREYALPVINQPHFERTIIEDGIRDLLVSGRVGLFTIQGSPGVGKTQAIAATVRNLYDKIENNASICRPIFYFDFDHDDALSFEDLREFITRINSKILEASPFRTKREYPGNALFSLIDTRKKDDVLESESPTPEDIIIAWANLQPRILIIDNLTNDQLTTLSPLIARFKKLSRSLVVITKVQDQNHEAAMQIEALSAQEFRQYFAYVHSDQEANARDLVADEHFGFSGGNLRAASLLEYANLFASINKSSNAAIPSDHLAQQFMTNFTAQHGNLLEPLMQLTHFPHGLPREFMRSVDISDDQINTLIEQKALIELPRKSYTSNARTGNFYTIPTYLRRAIQSINADTNKAATDNLLSKIEANLGLGAEDNSIDANIAIPALVSNPNQYIIFSDLIDTIVQNETYFGMALPILSLSEQTLYQQDQFDLLYSIWKKIIDKQMDPGPIPYLRLGKVAHQLSDLTTTKNCIDKASDLDLTNLERVDFNILYANYLKDVGERTTQQQIEALLDEALQFIILEIELTPGDDTLHEKRALILYNRSIFRRWWLRDKDAATLDINEAIHICRTRYDWLYHLALSEKCDMSISSLSTKQGITSAQLDLQKAILFFEDYRSDSRLAWCYYRMAKLVKRSIDISKSQQIDLGTLTLMHQYYAKCYRSAEAAHHLILQCASDVHQVAIELFVYVNNKDVFRQYGWTESSIRSKMDHSIISLTGIKVVWAKRLLRDLLWHKIQFLKTAQVNSNRLHEVYRNAIRLAMELNASQGTDMKRAANLVGSYLELLMSENDLIEIQSLRLQYNETITGWLSQPEVTLNNNQLLQQILAFSTKPDNYYG